jgi:hypothetical protein
VRTSNKIWQQFSGSDTHVQHLRRDSRAAPEGRPPPSDDTGALLLGSASSRGRLRLAVGELACNRTVQKAVSLDNHRWRDVHAPYD